MMPLLRCVQTHVWVLAIAAVALPTAISGQTVDLLSGTWKLNVARSTHSPASLAPTSGTTKFDVTKDTIKAVVDGVDSQGRATHFEYTAKFDGKDYPWKGTIDGHPNPNQDAVAWKRIDDYTYEAISKLKGQVLTTQRTVIDRDGKTRTNTVTGKNAKGQTVNHTLVYERQQGHAVKQCLSGRTTGADASHE